MRKRYFGIVAVALLFALPAEPQFGIPGIPQIVFDPSTEAQVVQDVEAAVRLYQLEQQMAAFVRNPQSLSADLNNALAVAGQVSQMNPNLMTQQSVQRLGAAIALARTAAQAAQNPSSMTTANGVLLATMQLQQVQAITQMNDQQTQMNYQDQLRQYRANDAGLGNAVAQMTAWHVRQ